MLFSRATYENLITEQTETQRRFFAQYSDANTDFDVIIVGSGMGGGILADDLADTSTKRILVLEAGSYLFPTHVYNTSRLPNADVARKYAVKTFTQTGDDNAEYHIHERPQLNFGGRSIFWSGLIPKLQPWELEFFPPGVRVGIERRLDAAALKLNASVTLGHKAQEIVHALQQSSLADHFIIQETPRALHQPYLSAAGTPEDDYWIEPTGVFNTAELLINQLGLNPDDPALANSQRLQVLLNHCVETVEQLPGGRYRLNVKNVVADQDRQFTASTVVLAAGSIESPKIVRRSPVFTALTAAIQGLIGKGLTDHPTTHWIDTFVTHIGDISIPRDAHAKIIFYSRGRTDNSGSIIYPFNIEMNINHEYWHLRENDPTSRPPSNEPSHVSRLQIKFSFGNFLDDDNAIEFPAAGSPPYVPPIRFRNLNWVGDLAEDRFRSLAGWDKDIGKIWDVLNELTYQIFSQFKKDGSKARPEGEIWFGQGGKGFGSGTVHHAVGSLRMPFKDRFNAPAFNLVSVVDANLMVQGHPNLYVCDMSVMPYSSSANPVLTLAALALRLSEHIATN